LSSFDVTTAYRALAFMIDGEPEIAELVVDLRGYLIQMPTPLRIAARLPDSSIAEVGGEHRDKPAPPK
jgi:hypothetical protein